MKYHIGWLVMSVIALTATVRAQPATQPTNDRATLEKQFEQTMTGAVLVGRYTSGERGDAAALPREDRYTIVSARKLPGDGDLWVLTARIQYGNKDVTVPLIIPVKWAGDTPMISVTDMAIPGLGTYTARVMFYRGQYAGTWSGVNHGGHLWGRIERADAATTNPATNPAGSAP
jgi:hypothetical protein